MTNLSLYYPESKLMFHILALDFVNIMKLLLRISRLMDM